MAELAELSEIADAPAIDEGGQEQITKLMIAVPKANGEIEIDYSQTPMEVHLEAIRIGYQELLNRKLTKHKSSKGMTGKQAEEAKAAIMKQVQENLADVYAGRIRVKGGKAKEKVAGPEVVALAKKMALRSIKDKIKANKGKIGNYKPATLNAGAKKLVEDNPKWIELAKAQLEAQAKAVSGIAVEGIDLAPDPELLAASEAADAAKAAKVAAKKPKAKKGSEARANA